MRVRCQHKVAALACFKRVIGVEVGLVALTVDEPELLGALALAGLSSTDAAVGRAALELLSVVVVSTISRRGDDDALGDKDEDEEEEDGDDLTRGGGSAIGHRAVLDAIAYATRARSAPGGRFGALVRVLSPPEPPPPPPPCRRRCEDAGANDMKDPLATCRSVAGAKALETSPLALRRDALVFVNALLSSAPDLEERLELRAELVHAGLIEALQTLRATVLAPAAATAAAIALEEASAATGSGGGDARAVVALDAPEA